MRYTPDHTGLGRLLRSRGLQDACVEAAEHGADWVRSRAPHDSGDYRAGIGVRRARAHSGDRAAAELVADAPHSAALEFGNRRTKARHLLSEKLAPTRPAPCELGRPVRRSDWPRPAH